MKELVLFFVRVSMIAYNVFGNGQSQSTKEKIVFKIRACSSLSWAELFTLTTASPAQYLQKTDLGHLSVGTEADIAVWSIHKGVFGFQDSAHGYISGSEKLECEMTFRAGELVWDVNARNGTPYKTLLRLYGLETDKEVLVRPS